MYVCNTYIHTHYIYIHVCVCVCVCVCMPKCCRNIIARHLRGLDFNLGV